MLLTRLTPLRLCVIADRLQQPSGLQSEEAEESYLVMITSSILHSVRGVMDRDCSQCHICFETVHPSSNSVWMRGMHVKRLE